MLPILKARRYVVSVLVCVLCHLLGYCQFSDSSTYLHVNLSDDSLSASFAGKPLPIHSPRQLDDYLKEHAQSLKQIDLMMESKGENKYETTHTVIDVLEKYKFASFVRRAMMAGPKRIGNR